MAFCISKTSFKCFEQIQKSFEYKIVVIYKPCMGIASQIKRMSRKSSFLIKLMLHNALIKQFFDI
jgi:hypothetical protein